MSNTDISIKIHIIQISNYVRYYLPLHYIIHYTVYSIQYPVQAHCSADKRLLQMLGTAIVAAKITARNYSPRTYDN